MVAAVEHAKVATVARAVAVAKVADLVQEKAKEVAVRRPDGRRPQEIHQAAVGLTTRKRASECSSCRARGLRSISG